MSEDIERGLVERFEGGDAEAAMEMGYLLSPRDIFAADAWFRAAVRAGGSTLMHRVIEYLETNPPQHASLVGSWRRDAGRALFPRAVAPDIHVAVSAFMQLNERGIAVVEPDPFVVIQAGHRGVAQAAVRRAVERLRSDQPTLGFSEVRADSVGAHVTIESERPRFAQLYAFLDAVIFELAAAGVRTAYIRPENEKGWLGDDQPEPLYPEEVARAAERAVGDTTGEAAFVVGVWCQENGYHHLGDVWFQEAARAAPFEMRLRIVNEYATRYCDWNGERLATWITRSLRLEFPPVEAPRIRVHGGLFAPIVLHGCAGYGHDTSVRIVSPQPEAATRALEVAAGRFGRVTLDGREFATNEELEAAAPDGDDGWDGYYTPNFVSGVTLDDGHPSLWMDWKDNMAPTMARTMIYILIEELLRAGVKAATVRPRPKTDV